ncbi:MAG: 3-methyl-2-oxobutanoate dehydrogenase subunit VorB [Lentisphaerae bacterium]|nr:3-methyl-2-oxobutanoate dehydrogenase subunit VorB [Lentisphaerota bacterium]
MRPVSSRVLMTGNDAAAEGAIRAGCRCYFGYPITPQNELIAYMAKHMPDRGRVFIQSESELAAISMVYGSAATGIRAMTSSSSPGISLKQEGISYLAAARLPSVIVNVQRGGPGLGGIEPSQGDYFQAVKGGGHGDYHMIVLAPDSVQEMHDLTAEAFDLADRYRTPVMVLADGRIGQMMEPIRLREEQREFPAKPWALTGARNRKPRIVRSLFVEEGALEKLNRELQAQYRLIEREEVRFEELLTSDCSVLVAAWGTCARVAKSAIRKARAAGLAAGLLRPITVWPFPTQRLAQLAETVKAILVVEMNSGQMLEDVRLAVNGRVPVHFQGFLGSRIPSETEILTAIRNLSPASAPGRRKPRKSHAPQKPA